ncbi:hypothetical protein SAMN05216498_0020 [Tenuibacillus multivorans]|uniref:Uncharacterized protein n=1 Tax=Tenuibacillus multivorans TaxID=237069 RepID=A0A1H0EQJ9_9BACI|nr:hypothetical protein SAMN05216498_0020 [Tenuibacillus multivorans]
MKHGKKSGLFMQLKTEKENKFKVGFRGKNEP